MQDFRIRFIIRVACATTIVIFVSGIILVTVWYYCGSMWTVSSPNKSLSPYYPYIRQSTIRHVEFKPKIFRQTKISDFDYRKKIDEIIENKNYLYDGKMKSIIRNYLIHQPSLRPYSLEQMSLFDYSGGQSATVDSLLKFKEDGFYVECCDTDGENRSNSLFFERVRRWNGLVIVSEPKKFSALLVKNRKSMSMNACLSAANKPEMKLINNSGNQTDVHCFPLQIILSAIERSNIDFLSLDVGGHEELPILQTIPFSELTIDVIAVRFSGEMRHFKSELQLFMENVGYDTMLKLVKDDNSVHHLVLKRKTSLFLTYDITKICLFLALSMTVISIVYFYSTMYYQGREPRTILKRSV